jgi:uncharacterized protein YabN with tetrapyrrole methylase and pyrophosphatase domain
MPGHLVVVGTGIQWAAQTTLAAERSIRAADKVLYAVADPWAAEWITDLNASAESLSYPRDGRSRAAIYEAMVERIMRALDEQRRVCVVFYGSPVLLADAAHAAVQAARRAGHTATLLPGVSCIDCLFCDLNLDPAREGYQVLEAEVFLRRSRSVDPSMHLVLCQVALVGARATFDPQDTARVETGLLKLQTTLASVYGASHRVFIYEASSHPLSPTRLEEIALNDLSATSVSEASTLYLPPLR